MEAQYKRLDWDSDFFGFKVARIAFNQYSDDEFKCIISNLKKEGYRLAYFMVPEKNKDLFSLALSYGGFHADEKVTFLKSTQLGVPFDGAPTIPTFSITGGFTEELSKLAIESSIFSRFRIDPHFPSQSCDRLYKLWMERSLKREIAIDVLGIKNGESLAGAVTVGLYEGRGNIGLISVMESSRGLGIGKALLLGAERRVIAEGLPLIQVVTQGKNLAACRLYEKCNYVKEKTENVFHFWMN